MADNDKLQESINKLSKAFQAFGAELSKALAPIVKALNNIINQYSDLYFENANPKLKHLAFHSKKARVRKKNLNRIIKEATKSLPYSELITEGGEK